MTHDCILKFRENHKSVLRFNFRETQGTPLDTLGFGGQKVIEKLSKKLSKSCKKLTKSHFINAMYHWSFFVSREAIQKKKKRVVGLGWVR
jgi:hypothetical protein